MTFCALSRLTLSRKFLDTESPGWVTDGLISEAQRQKLLARYPPEAQALGLLPVLGSMLVGLSGLSVVAANWQGLPATLRLALLLGSLLGSYRGGRVLFAARQPRFGPWPHWVGADYVRGQHHSH